MGIREIIALIFLAAGLFFLIASAVGMLRLPDFYTRLHASGNSETLGLMLSQMCIRDSLWSGQHHARRLHSALGPCGRFRQAP